MGDDITTAATEDVVVEAPAEETDMLAWHGVLAPTGVLSGDRRRFSTGGITNRDLPLPMQWVEKSSFGHDGAEVVGNIETIDYNAETGLIHFTGHRLNSPRAQIVADQIESGALRGVSVDLDQTVVEYVNEDGTPFDVETWMPGQPEPIAQITEGRIAAATIVAIPAFQEAFVALGAEGEKPEFEEPLVAAAAPAYRLAVDQVTYPADWFLDPEFTKPTPMTITEDGRVFGHVAAFGTCHIGFNQRECVTPPHSSTKYAFYLLKSVLTDQGELAVGTITLGTGHAPLKMTAAQAMSHYDNTGSVVAFVNSGEDEHGIWFAGALKSNVTAQQIEELRGATLSGDWRPTPYGREFVAALAVNVPGFPIPRVQFSQSSEGVGALVAAAMIPPRPAGEATSLDYVRLAANVVDEIEARQAKKDNRVRTLAAMRLTFDHAENRDGLSAIQRLRDAL